MVMQNHIGLQWNRSNFFAPVPAQILPSIIWPYINEWQTNNGGYIWWSIYVKLGPYKWNAFISSRWCPFRGRTSSSASSRNTSSSHFPSLLEFRLSELNNYSEMYELLETVSHKHILKHPKFNCKCMTRCINLKWNKIRICTLAKSCLSMI